MFLRIQQGRLRGRRIPVPPQIKKHAHFTPSLIKEAALQIIENRCSPVETVFFDLCAGSGQMGFEAFSRGFRTVVLAEIDSGRIGLLRSTATELGAGETDAGGLTIQRKDFRRMAAAILKEERAAVFIDPPYTFWQQDDCPPVREFLENLIRLRGAEPSAEPAGETIILLQGPAGLEFAPSSEKEVFEIRRHGRHYLTLLHLLPGKTGGEAEIDNKI